MSTAETNESRWLLLIHQIPPKPNYFRVKIWRRLQGLGAVAIKNSVYALPKSEQTQEDLQWVLREVVAGGGEASLVEARFIEGLGDEQVEAMFHAARDADYAQVAADARALADKLPPRRALDDDERGELETDLARLKRRLADVAAIDFFGAPGRMVADKSLEGLESRLRDPAKPEKARSDKEHRRPTGATWVTRKGIHVDRMASAWLIRRFIDEKAQFKFVAAWAPAQGAGLLAERASIDRSYQPVAGELRFDMFDGEYTHEGDRCSFEVLLAKFGVREAGLLPIAEMVHDIDLKDGKFGRPETAGFAHLVAGIALAHREDDERLARASAVLDDLYAYFQRKR